jgi:hypothetical protein
VRRLVAALVLGAVGCALAGEVPTDQASCERRGGKWGPAGLLPTPICNLPTHDGGKPCRDRKDCESACLAELTPEQRKTFPVRTTGKCAAWRRTVGCIAEVEDGWVRAVVCVD